MIPPRQTKSQRKEGQQKEALQAGYAAKIVKEIEAALAASGCEPLTSRQAAVLKRALRQQYEAFCIAVRMEAGRLFQSESSKLEKELAAPAAKESHPIIGADAGVAGLSNVTTGFAGPNLKAVSARIVDYFGQYVRVDEFGREAHEAFIEGVFREAIGKGGSNVGS